ncbi:MAG: phosphoribosylamine--glycine ligase [Clostridiales bacterium]|nr:phosphoribosylamine--glycine ligase [Clostridiales bacterium]
MKILMVGGGGREHALVWKLLKSPKVGEIHCAPGNGGIGRVARNVPLAATDIEGITAYAVRERMDWVFVAPDDPLALGLTDALEAAGVRAFGPGRDAARIEGSKVFAKELMKKYGIPTADWAVFDDPAAARDCVRAWGAPVVVKADGLALGKGVMVCATLREAEAAIDAIMIERRFGNAGQRVVIEECLTGPEVSALCFTDGKTVVPMVSSQDHKRALDGDMGMNTGGMGAIAPSPRYSPELAGYVEEHILKPTIAAMAREGCPFRGVLYVGLMLTEKGPRVLEYNARLGDPETQAMLPLLETDLVDIIEAIREERLADCKIEWSAKSAVTVVMASGGYPGSYRRGLPITGIEAAQSLPGVTVFHAGTAWDGERFLTAGGRVLGVTALAGTLADAIDRAYEGVARIDFADAHYRTDIGRR